MDISPVISEEQHFISSYGNHRFVINKVTYSHSLLLHPLEGVQKKEPLEIEALTIGDLDFLLSAEEKPELILIGTGNRHQLISTSLQQALRAIAVRTEAMDTGAACRTYNVLAAEERRVAAVLVNI